MRIRIKHFNVVTIYGEISQNEKKVRQYMSLKDVIQNNFWFGTERAFGCVPLLRDPPVRRGWSQMTGFTVHS